MPALKNYDIVINYTIAHLLLCDAHNVIIQALYDNGKEKLLLSLPLFFL